MALENLWYAMMGAISLAFIGILLYTRNKKYIAYFITGALVGFYLDFVSVSQGYYTYHPYFPFYLGVPLTVTVAEGCSIAITIFLYKEVLPKLAKKLFKK